MDYSKYSYKLAFCLLCSFHAPHSSIHGSNQSDTWPEEKQLLSSAAKRGQVHKALPKQALSETALRKKILPKSLQGLTEEKNPWFSILKKKKGPSRRYFFSFTPTH